MLSNNFFKYFFPARIDFSLARWVNLMFTCRKNIPFYVEFSRSENDWFRSLMIYKLLHNYMPQCLLICDLVQLLGIRFLHSYSVMLRFLRLLTCVSLGILPDSSLIDRADNSYMSLSFFFLLFFSISSLLNWKICSNLLFSEYVSVLNVVHPFLIFLIASFLNLLSFCFSFPITLFCLLLLYLLFLPNLFSFCYCSSF